MKMQKFILFLNFSLKGHSQSKKSIKLMSPESSLALPHWPKSQRTLGTSLDKDQSHGPVTLDKQKKSSSGQVWKSCMLPGFYNVTCKSSSEVNLWAIFSSWVSTLILWLTDLTLNLWALKLNTNFLTQDYSHILHAYFVGVFCCSHPYRNVILS